MDNAHLQLPESEWKGDHGHRGAYKQLLVSPVIYLKVDRSLQRKQHATQKFNFKARTFNLKNAFTTWRKRCKITRLLSSIHGHRNWKMKKIKTRCTVSYILFNQSVYKIVLCFLWPPSVPKKPDGSHHVQLLSASLLKGSPNLFFIPSFLTGSYCHPV